MGLTAVEAALTGTTLGALATFSSAWLIQRATTRREHDSRVWEVRRAVYDEAVVVVHRAGHLRDEVLRTGAFPERPVGGADPEHDMIALVARMSIYGTDALVAACEGSREAMLGWTSAWGAWRTQPETNPRRSATDPLWVEFTRRVAASGAADARVLRELRREVRLERPRAWDRLRGRPRAR
ncbi:hypothetical protein [Streptomyces sp. PA5.6]|uniref:hypothetical protein n=1 Tax=Streptomyces sp. PA5.6 TaxID=3035651 RepID=UPI0039048DF1